MEATVEMLKKVVHFHMNKLDIAEVGIAEVVEQMDIAEVVEQMDTAAAGIAVAPAMLQPGKIIPGYNVAPIDGTGICWH